MIMIMTFTMIMIMIIIGIMIMIMIMIASPWSFAAISLWCRVQSMSLGQSCLAYGRRAGNLY